MAPNIRLWKRDAPPEGGETEGGGEIETAPIVPTSTVYQKVHFGHKHHTTGPVYPQTTPGTTESDLCKLKKLSFFLFHPFSHNYIFIVCGFEYYKTSTLLKKHVCLKKKYSFHVYVSHERRHRDAR